MAKKIIQDLTAIAKAEEQKLYQSQQQTQNGNKDFQEGYTNPETVFPLPGEKKSPLQQLTQPVKAHNPAGLQKIIDASRRGNNAKPFIQPTQLVEDRGNAFIPINEPTREFEPVGMNLSALKPQGILDIEQRAYDRMPTSKLPKDVQVYNRIYGKLDIPENIGEIRRPGYTKPLTADERALLATNDIVRGLGLDNKPIGEVVQSVVQPLMRGGANLYTGGNEIKQGDVLRGAGRTGLGAFETMIGVMPGVAGLNTFMPAINETSGAIAQKLGYSAEDGQKIAGILTPFIFGKWVGAGSLASTGVEKLLDESGILDNYKPEDKKLITELASNILFLATAEGGKHLEQGRQIKKAEREAAYTNAVDKSVRNSLRPGYYQPELLNPGSYDRPASPLEQLTRRKGPNTEGPVSPEAAQTLSDNLNDNINTIKEKQFDQPTKSIEKSDEEVTKDIGDRIESQNTNPLSIVDSNENAPKDLSSGEKPLTVPGIEINPPKSSNIRDILFGALDNDDSLSLKKLQNMARAADKAATPKEVKAIKIAWEKQQIQKRASQLLTSVENTNNVDIQPFEPEKNQNWATGVKNAIVNQERIERRLAPIETEGKRQWDTVWDEAQKEIENGRDPRMLATSLAKSPRTVTDTEHAILDYHRVQLFNEHRKVSENIVKAQKENDPTALTENKIALARIEDDINVNDQASHKAGTEIGRSLAIRRMMVKEDYSLPRLVQKARVANDGKPVSEDMKQRLEELSGKLQEAETKIAEYEERASQREFQKSVKEMEREIGYEHRKINRTKAREILDQEYNQLERELAKAYSVNSGITYQQAKVLTKMTKNRIQAGLNSIEGIVDELYQVVRNYAPDITKREIRDAISGYGKTMQMKQDDLSKDLREWKRQAKLISALEDAQAGVKPLNSGLQREPVSETVKDLQRQVREELKKQGFSISGNGSEEAALKAYKTRIQNRIKDLEIRLKTGDFSKPPKRTVIPDAEAMQLNAEVKRLQLEADKEIKRIALKNRTSLEKGLDWSAKFYRQVLLSGSNTIGKLGSAAFARTVVLKPIEELEGWGMSKIPGLSKIADKASIEGGGSVRAIARNYVEYVRQLTNWKDIKQTIKTGAGQLDILFGKKSYHSDPEAMEFFGHIHGLLKSPTKRASFFYALQKQSEWAIKNGYDLSEPSVQATVNAAAYEYGMRDILMQDNALVSAYKAFMATLEKKGTAGKVGSTVGKFVFPIVKVPTNFVSETFSYLGGGTKAAPLIYKAFKGGIENLQPEQANTIMRLLKKQAFGLGLLAIGYYNAQNFGGYYQEGEKRKKGELKAGRISLMGTELPVWASHIPAFEVMQFGATLRHIIDKEKKKGEEDPSLVDASLEATAELGGEVPFFQEPTEILKGPKKYITRMATSAILPPDVQKMARAQDTDNPLDYYLTGRGDVKKRYPKNVKQEFEAGIPYLRQEVSDTKEKSSKRRRIYN